MAADWIDVRDQLPDSGTSVLVACPGASEPVWIGYIDDDEQDPPAWRFADGSPAESVTHWMELPELPAEPKGRKGSHA